MKVTIETENDAERKKVLKFLRKEQQTKKTHKTWTTEEDNLLKKIPYEKREEAFKLIPYRTKASINTRYWRLGIAKKIVSDLFQNGNIIIK
jgi:hypothetical protein